MLKLQREAPYNSICKAAALYLLVNGLLPGVHNEEITEFDISEIVTNKNVCQQNWVVICLV